MAKIHQELLGTINEVTAAISNDHLTRARRLMREMIEKIDLSVGDQRRTEIPDPPPGLDGGEEPAGGDAPPAPPEDVPTTPGKPGKPGKPGR
jgi:hypothetical protein